MRNILLIILGAVIMFIVLKVLSKKTVKQSTSSGIKEILLLPETLKLAKTTEFKNLSDTPEFRNYIKTLSQEQIYELAKTLTA
jgi:hypothetical protein